MRDVARACLAALERPGAAGQVVNVGSGVSRTIEEVAGRWPAAVGRPDLQPQITGRYRAGDIRHCFADIDARARRARLRARRRTSTHGLAELAEWLAGEVAVDRVDEATAELARRGLVA